MSAHDAPRYIGDMLAWIHSALIAETEAFDALLKSFLLSDQYIESLTPHEADRNGAAMVQILRNSLSPVCDILKVLNKANNISADVRPEHDILWGMPAMQSHVSKSGIYFISMKRSSPKTQKQHQ